MPPQRSRAVVAIVSTAAAARLGLLLVVVARRLGAHGLEAPAAALELLAPRPRRPPASSAPAARARRAIGKGGGAVARGVERPDAADDQQEAEELSEIISAVLRSQSLYMIVDAEMVHTVKKT